MHEQIAALIAAYTRPLLHNPTADEVRSARFAEVERSLIAEISPSDEGVHLVRWVHRARELTAFATDSGRFPRENNRASAGTISRDESSVHEWVRLQRRATSRDRHCAYQVRRLELIVGFSWDPHGDAWERRFAEYRQFITEHRRAPRSRSESAAERGLAYWAAEQRAQHRRGRLDPVRVAALRELSIWTW